MRRCSIVAISVIVAALVGCGGHGTLPAADVKACVTKHVPPGAVDRVFSNTEEGVTSINYFHHGAETDLTIFKSVADAEAAERAEARLGDAHDRRVGNVLYSGGGAVAQAIAGCLR